MRRAMVTKLPTVQTAAAEGPHGGSSLAAVDGYEVFGMCAVDMPNDISPHVEWGGVESVFPKPSRVMYEECPKVSSQKGSR